MQFLTTVTAAAALLAPALAAPAAVPEAMPEPEAAAMAAAKAPATYWFNVTQWTAGCARAGCFYDFNVSAPQTDVYPGFKAYCSGDDTGYFKACEILGGKPKGKANVSAKLKHENLSKPDGIAQMSVSLQFTNVKQGATYNYTGHHNASYNQFVAPVEKFRVIPTEAWAIA